jgi:hypothetical protein
MNFIIAINFIKFIVADSINKLSDIHLESAQKAGKIILKNFMELPSKT